MHPGLQGFQDFRIRSIGEWSLAPGFDPVIMYLDFRISLLRPIGHLRSL
jgi:hypothetical protein